MRKYLGLSTLMVLAVILIFFLESIACASEDVHTKELVDLESRPGVAQKFILLAPEKPVASVVLIGGGSGKFGMYSSFGSPAVKNDGNFMVRTRKDFAQEGLAVAVMDVCSDMKASKKGMTTQWRIGEEHVQDINTVAMFMKKKYGLPVWVVGTSRGTFSAVNAAIHLGQDIRGIVLTSSITRRPKADSFKRGVLDMEIQQITLPVLIIAHTDDQCFFSPADGANAIKAALTKSIRVEVELFSGGKKPKTKACMPLSQHGFFGIEKEVVGYISDFIKSN